MKGIILAGGSGTRLYPITKGISKQLMPIYDKPMVYYPLATLIQGGISEILIITTPQDEAAFKNLLGDGKAIGCRIEYAVQPKPEGLAQAFIIGEEFIGKDAVYMILGDNLFYGDGFDNAFNAAISKVEVSLGGVVFAYHVNDPERYGVVEFDKNQTVVSIEEKPTTPKSNFAVPGIYFFDNQVISFAKLVKPSVRGELEIPDIHNMYLQQGNLSVQVIDRGNAWLDTGTVNSMMQASQFIQVIEERQNQKVGCIEEAAFNNGLITAGKLRELAQPLIKSGYGKYLLNLIK
jgi:glucose-1-phosphate thymidylyltransferase